MNKKLACLSLIIFGMILTGVANGVFGKETTFPNKPIELVCPWGAGGSTSMGGRIIAGTLSELIGTPVIVVYKTAGGGVAAANYVAKSKPDGYTLLINNSSINAIWPAIRSIEYKNSDFEPLALYGLQPLGLAVKSDAPWKTLQELIAYAKNNPGRLKFGTSGFGTGSHLGMELFKHAAGLKMDVMPLKSGAECVAGVLGGHIQMTLLYMVDLKGSYEAGKLRILATAEEKRLEEYPEIPTFGELGYSDVQVTVWYGIAARAGVPKMISDKLKDALYKTIKTPDVSKMLTKIGYIPVFKDSVEFGKFISSEEKKYLKIAKEANIKLEE